MTRTTLSTKRSGLGPFTGDFDIARILLEGRAFFALIAIIIVFSILSPYYTPGRNCCLCWIPFEPLT